MAKIAIGEPAPDFTLTTDTGESVTLASCRGRKLVLYFYPKAGTQGCTIEAHDFNRLKAEFDAADTRVVGISPDPDKALAKFRTKEGLTFALAGDEEHRTLEDYGVWVEKSMYGRKYMGVERTTVLVDREGRIARLWPKVKVAGHAEEVLAAAKAL
ncbi:Putative peroxiredoxin bcp [Starkeya nomas]|uniref:thioredoxin-dependent peroxiredoxin n=2 Tax=Xanthobacteraceae TaxID=335928 RepID=A0A5S9NFG8_9HYPH|nr:MULTISPECIES: thioredoxin-dependent thiol peroxidase [Xanthobacteraceae]TSJ62017.1 thioredoxin-dependent thiol peroxidase [Ancylobacter moscoviensis]CAA0089179.1 Putative peroxiredoxin bcp [Starkeya nomas]